MAMVLKPIRGKSKTIHKTAANNSAQPKKNCLAVSRILSTSTSSLGSEVVEEGPLGSPRKVVQEVPDKHETTEGVGTKHTNKDAHEESVKDQREGTGKALMTETVVEKPKNHSRVSTMSMFECV